MRYQRILVTLALLALLVTSVAQLGCGSDEASASTDGEESNSAQPAKDSDDGESGKAAESADNDEDGEEGEDEDKEEPVPVEVTELARGDIESLLRYSANLDAEILSGDTSG